MKKIFKLYHILILAFILLCSLTVVVVSNTTGLNAGSNKNKTSEGSSSSDTSDKNSETEINENLPVITIDAGHGGYDPGKVGVDGLKEKDVNLQIALYLKDILTENGFRVYLTRDTDISLYEEGAASKKTSDLNRRIAIASENNSDLLISIHQNSFSDSSIHGAQVFYYEGSDEGKSLAEAIQGAIKETVDTDNERPVKGNSEYMILKYSSCTALIVECGFLSNPDECALLSASDYQQMMAKAIADGIISSLNETVTPGPD